MGSARWMQADSGTMAGSSDPQTGEDTQERWWGVGDIRLGNWYPRGYPGSFGTVASFHSLLFKFSIQLRGIVSLRRDALVQEVMFATVWWEAQATWIYSYVPGALELKPKPTEISRRTPIYFTVCGCSRLHSISSKCSQQQRQPHVINHPKALPTGRARLYCHTACPSEQWN